MSGRVTPLSNIHLTTLMLNGSRKIEKVSAPAQLA
jgi:hypothetical protein